jgi:hypothetical protein
MRQRLAAQLSFVLRPIACLVVLAAAVMAAQGAGRATVFVGVDFTHASFYDEHLLSTHGMTQSHEDPIHDLLDAKIPSWNRESAIFFGELAPKYGMAGDVDLSTSEELNKGVGAGAVKWSAPPRSSASALTPELLQTEVKPYIKADAADTGILVVVDQVNKKYGVIAQVIAFERSTGRIIYAERLNGSASGFGLRNYYLNGLKRVIKDGMKNIERAGK